MARRTLIPSGFAGEMEIVISDDMLIHMENNSVTSQLYITHIGYYPKAKDHFRERPNGAEQYIFIYCESGKGWVEYNNERMALNKNHFIILPPGERHCYGSDAKDPWNIYWLHFKGFQASFFSSVIGKNIEIMEADNSRIHDRFYLFAEMYRNLENGYNLANLEYTSFCLMHFLASLKYILSFREIKSIKEIDHVQKCIQYMKDHLEEKITLKEIADTAGYSVPRINILFHKEIGASPMEYLTKLKIQRSCTYLVNSTLKIKEIAFRLNYFDQFHFSKVFLKEMKQTPSEYRKRKKHMQEE